MYVADLVNDVIYVLNRENCTEINRIGGAAVVKRASCIGRMWWLRIQTAKCMSAKGRRSEDAEVYALWRDGRQQHRQRGSGQVLAVI